MTDTTNLVCTNDDSPAEVVLLHGAPDDRLGALLCAGCATCTDTACGELATILDAVYAEPWCAEHARQYEDGGQIDGPDIVPLDHDRARWALDGQQQ